MLVGVGLRARCSASCSRRPAAAARRSAAGRSAAAIAPTSRWRWSPPGSPTPPARRREQAAIVTEVIGAVRDIRRLGSAALDLCYVAAGRYDAYFETGLNSWDAAAGELIAREAGCRSGDHRGGPAQPGRAARGHPGDLRRAAGPPRCRHAADHLVRADRCGGIASAIGHHGAVGTRILAVEDDERIREAVKLALEDEGWTVEGAGSARRPSTCSASTCPTSC